MCFFVGVCCVRCGWVVSWRLVSRCLVSITRSVRLLFFAKGGVVFARRLLRIVAGLVWTCRSRYRIVVLVERLVRPSSDAKKEFVNPKRRSLVKRRSSFVVRCVVISAKMHRIAERVERLVGQARCAVKGNVRPQRAGLLCCGVMGLVCIQRVIRVIAVRVERFVVR